MDSYHLNKHKEMGGNLPKPNMNVVEMKEVAARSQIPTCNDGAVEEAMRENVGEASTSNLKEQVENAREASRAVRRLYSRLARNGGKWNRRSRVDWFIAELLMNDSNAIIAFQQFKYFKIREPEP